MIDSIVLGQGQALHFNANDPRLGQALTVSFASLVTTATVRMFRHQQIALYQFVWMQDGAGEVHDLGADADSDIPFKIRPSRKVRGFVLQPRTAAAPAQILIRDQTKPIPGLVMGFASPRQGAHNQAEDREATDTLALCAAIKAGSPAAPQLITHALNAAPATRRKDLAAAFVGALADAPRDISPGLALTLILQSGR
jgi:hypothetical protein